MNTQVYEAPKVVFEGQLEVKAGSTVGDFGDDIFADWD